MSDAPRKKSPRAPSMPLKEALEKALRIYDRERRHPIPTDVIAQGLGYKSANNGAALAAIASLRSFGLLEKAADGKLAVSKGVETYKFAPSEELKSELQIKWLRAPAVFSDLLEKYGSGLPSDAKIRFDLIQGGFNPATADSVLTVFKQSADFAKLFESGSVPANPRDTALGSPPDPTPVNPMSVSVDSATKEKNEVIDSSPVTHDRIPVRLPGGRKAWLEIPSPFFSADKTRLKAQIDLLLAEDDDENSVGD